MGNSKEWREFRKISEEERNQVEHTHPDCQCEGRRCTDCAKVKCIQQFSKNGKRDRQSYCLDCSRIRCATYRQNNPEKESVRHKNYNADHKEQNQEKWQEYSQKIDRGGYHSNYRLANLERLKEKDRLYGKSPKKRAYAKRRYQATRDRQIVAATSWRRNNLARWAATQAHRRTLQTLAGGSYTVTEWQILKSKYNYTCLCCSKREPEIKLTADHIIPVTKGGTSFIDNIQPLCGPCNSRKRNRTIDYRPELENYIAF